MSNLSNIAVNRINEWSEFNPAAGQALIDAAARSPYLASQFNQFFDNGGKLKAVKN